jgi:hypothetical protein
MSDYFSINSKCQTYMNYLGINVPSVSRTNLMMLAMTEIEVDDRTKV